MCAPTRARLAPYCCELIPILIGPPASAVSLDINQSTRAVIHKVSDFAFIARAQPARRQTAPSCLDDARRSATSLKATLLSRGACRRFHTVEHAVDQQRPRSHGRTRDRA